MDKDNINDSEEIWTSKANVGFGLKFQVYIGSIDPETTRRHGLGKYTYSNPFFTYEGEYVDGKKNGRGTLKMNSGTKIYVRLEILSLG